MVTQNNNRTFTQIKNNKYDKNYGF
jgi:hypothetical protein